MHDFNALKWTRITLFSLFVVALLGALMRYKIAFSFPFFNQKNLQHAHSHFAFAGWVSQLLMIYMVALVGNSTTQLKRYERILTGNLALAFGMLIAFSLQGYGLLSIAFSTATVALSFYFIYWYLKDLRHSSFIAQPQWFYIAMACNVVSAHGTLLLSIMMATHSINQHVYLASVYWYLHFQYNGWFFFAIMGLFVHYFHNQTGVVISKKVWILMGSSILPAYGLSILWL
jgi:hypothetical protein